MYQPPQGPYGYPPPQTIIVKQESGCLKAFLILVGIIVAGNVATCVACGMLAGNSSHTPIDAAALDASTND